MSERAIDDLRIHFESIYALEKELRESSLLQNEAHKAYAQANKEVNRLTLELEIAVAEVVDDICRNESVPPSARSEVRRSRVASDRRYVRARGRLNDAIERKECLEGLSNSWGARGFRLGDLARLADRLLIPEPKVYGNPNQDKIKTMTDNTEEDEFDNLE